jgi:dTDP-4-amino-4,6-dideoxygalactose transaminase
MFCTPLNNGSAFLINDIGVRNSGNYSSGDCNDHTWLDQPGHITLSSKPIYVTQPFLPPLEELTPFLEEIWSTRLLTNSGPFHQRLETALAEYLGVPHVALFANGTLALVTALQAMRVTGEVITTPYTFAATAHCLLWNGIRPVFVDIDRLTCNLDPEKIEAAITPQTTAILPVHCYGNPCDTQRIQAIADTYGLKVIYDAAHAFAVRSQGCSLLESGDLSILSFHATKVFNTFEGGAIVCHDAKMKQRIDYLKNFGFADEVTVVAPGINGKMNEFQAAVGLLQLPYMAQILECRAAIARRYDEGLASILGIQRLPTPAATTPNYAYYPILVGPEYALSRDALYERFKQHNIHVRRYFYPLLSNLPMYRGLPSASAAQLTVATRIADRVLCLPIYPDLASDVVDSIIRIIAAN